MRRVVTALLLVVLALAGAGRGFAAASDALSTGFPFPGVIVHICHAGGVGSASPDDQSHRDCCDACALLVPMTLADALSLRQPASVTFLCRHAEAMTWLPASARRRTPRQSQGPPRA